MLKTYLDVLPPLLMVVTDEEDRLIEDIFKQVRPTCDVLVWNESFGLLKADQYIEEWSVLRYPEDVNSFQLLPVIKEAYRASKSSKRDNLYHVLLDADTHLKNPSVRRSLKNFALATQRNVASQRSLILVSKTGIVPTYLQGLVEVYHYGSIPAQELRAELGAFEDNTRLAAKEPGITPAQKALVENFTLPAGRDVADPIPDEFIRACEGLTGYQIREMLNYLMADKDFVITVADVVRKRRDYLPTRDFLEVVNTDLAFKDIAGMDRLKVWLKEAGASFTPEGKSWGLPPCKGVLLVGIPGCGKSLTAKALGNEIDLPVLRFDPGKVFGPRVGDSESNMRRALKDIESMSPCVVWIDEIEKGFAGLGSSSRTDSGTTARVIGTFLSWYEEHAEDVFMVATANGIDALPPEMISRFEEIFFVNLPDALARRECFELQLDRYWTPEMGSRDVLDYGAMSHASEGLTGREIEKAVKEGLRHAFVRGKSLETEHFLQAIEDKPPLSQVLREDIDKLTEWVSYDPDRDEGVRARFASEPTHLREESESVTSQTLRALSDIDMN